MNTDKNTQKFSRRHPIIFTYLMLCGIWIAVIIVASLIFGFRDINEHNAVGAYVGLSLFGIVGGVCLLIAAIRLFKRSKQEHKPIKQIFWLLYGIMNVFFVICLIISAITVINGDRVFDINTGRFFFNDVFPMIIY